MAVSKDNPLALCRTFLFIPGADEAALLDALNGDGDVLVQELEDFTPPERRAEARQLAARVMQHWRECGRISSVRINPFETCGLEDLEAVMAARPQVVMMSKVESREQMALLDWHITRLEGQYGIAAGSTLIVPNIETALGVVRAIDIAHSTPRIKAMLVATEDMVADLGAGRSRAGTELFYPRSRFLLECAAAGVLAIDSPYTFADDEGAEADMQFARSIGYQAKGVVNPAHVAVANRYLTPTAAEAELAQRQIDAFEHATRSGSVRAEVDGLVVEVPSYLQSRRLLERYQQLLQVQASRGAQV
ncbi:MULTISPECIES: HpcH/HpaI aldolase/citrate lyase family protein [Pseudomonas]|uniref:CoA ester lyase n=1 Tax=Pseudomonas muyukensis TaxID=2842357 RepID=A0ABX8ME84_9PSED|nr:MULTISPECIES: CoA ester lyase [Pseudomonas]MCO7519878.1 CoA ester lyase [Pseudomonas sp. 1]MCO7540573.1 CoA ester lyase [Pseudomonas sp. VA159-2]QXH36639.1 CoA ester lyase [Pseudomonas muyukensis]